MNRVAITLLIVPLVALWVLGQHTLSDHLDGVFLWTAEILWAAAALGLLTGTVRRQARVQVALARALSERHDALVVAHEELEVANEELQTRAEELESTNEELMVTSDDLAELNEEYLTQLEEIEQTRDALRAERDGHAAVLRAVPDTILVLDGALEVIVCNHEPDAPTLLQPAVRAAMLEVLQGGEDRHLLDVTDQAGHHFDVHVALYAAIDGPHLLVVLSDCSARSRLARTERVLARVMVHTLDPLFCVDREGIVLIANPAADALSTGDRVGQALTEVLPCASPSWLAAQASRETVSVVHTAAGVPMSVRVSPTADGWSLTLRDDRARARRERRMATQTSLLRILHQPHGVTAIADALRALCTFTGASSGTLAARIPPAQTVRCGSESEATEPWCTALLSGPTHVADLTLNLPQALDGATQDDLHTLLADFGPALETHLLRAQQAATNAELTQATQVLGACISTVTDRPDLSRRLPADPPLNACWVERGCLEANCPARDAKDHRCWLVANTPCTDDADLQQKQTVCRACPVYAAARVTPTRAVTEDFNTMLALLEAEVRKVRAFESNMAHAQKLAAIGQLVSGVAHELNNPLAAILGLTEVLCLELPDHRDDLDAIHDAAVRSQKIVRDLLDFARKRVAKFQDGVLITDVVQRAIEFAQHSLRTPNVRLITELKPDLPPVHADPHQLERVVFNLLHNAILAVQGVGGGTVRVAVAHGADGIKVTISDDGPGVPADIGERIFEPFFTSRAEGEGTGLGLSIAYGIAHAHGGTLRHIDAGRGATFELTLPAAQTHHPVAPTTALTPHGAQSALVVDDDAGVRRAIIRILRIHGIACSEAETGAGGLALVREHDFDIVLLDMRLKGGMNGIDTYHSISRERPHIAERVILVTGDTADTRTQALVSEMRVPVVAKPFAVQELMAAIRCVLDR